MELVHSHVLGPLLEVLLLHLDLLLLLQPQEVAGAGILQFVPDHGLEDVEEKLVVVLLEGEVAVEGPPQVPLHAVLLRGDERVQHDADGQVDVVVSHDLSQVHARKRLGHADDALDVPHGDRDAASCLALPPKLRVQLRHLVAVDLADLGSDVLLRVHNVLLEEALRYRPLPLIAALLSCCLRLRSLPRMAPVVRLDHKVRQLAVEDRVDGVLDHAQHVEARQDRLRELHVLVEVHGGVVPPALGVGSCYHGASCLQARHDPGLGHGDALLLHGLVDARPVLVRHLVELVDEAYSGVCQHQRSSLQRPLPRDRIAVDSGRQTDSARSLARGEDRAGHALLHVLEELGLGGTRIAEEEDVDVSADPVLARDVLRLPSEHGEGQGSLHVLVPEDGGCDTRHDLLNNLGILGELSDLGLVVLSQAEGRVDIVLLAHVVRLDDGSEDREAVLGVERGVKVVLVDPSHLHLLPGPCAVDQVSHQDHVLVPGQAASWHGARRFLHRHLLVVAVDRPFLVDNQGASTLAFRT
eukprot:761500-Hanusia_phi.AAC.2